MKKSKIKPKYNMFQNSLYMIKLAWKNKEKKVIILSLLSALTAVLINIINLTISPTILFNIEHHESLTKLLLTIIIFITLLIVTNAINTYVNENTIFGRISVRMEIINLLNKKAMTTSYANLNDENFVKLLEDAGNHCNANSCATEAIWDTLTNLLTYILGFIIYLFLLTTVQPILVLIIIITSLISYLITNYVNEYGYRHKDESAEIKLHLNYLYHKSKSRYASKEIKIFGLKSWFLELYEKAIKSLTAFNRKAEGAYIWANIVDLIMTFLRNAIAYTYLITMVIDNRISVAEFLLYFSVVSGFTNWILQILGGFNTLYKQSLDICVVRECLEYPEVFNFDSGIKININDFKKCEIKMENVSFKYQNTNKMILENINLTIHPGEKLAIVGLNGAGKTTLIKLICGLLDPTEGRVLLNNQDIREFNRTDYYSLFSAVFQNFSILAGSIKDNVTQDEGEADLEKLRNSLDKAGLLDKVDSLKNGYETKLEREIFEDAILLSGGEMQKMMLARALYKDAPIVILDEPTSALDPVAEAQMYQKYNEFTSGKLSVYISHRLASTRFCNRIIMIDNGNIIEEGTHDELLLKNGKYAELFNVQSKYYKEGDEANE